MYGILHYYHIVKANPVEYYLYLQLLCANIILNYSYKNNRFAFEYISLGTKAKNHKLLTITFRETIVSTYFNVNKKYTT